MENDMSVEVHLIRVQDADYKKLSEMAKSDMRTVPQQVRCMINEAYKNKEQEVLYMKRDYVSSRDELFASKGTIKSIIDSDISLLERQLKEDTEKNPNNKSSNSATLKAVNKYKKHFNKFVDDEFAIKEQ